VEGRYVAYWSRHHLEVDYCVYRPCPMQTTMIHDAS
jgi:hypothetical protein